MSPSPNPVRVPNPFLVLLQGSEPIGRKGLFIQWQNLFEQVAAGATRMMVWEGVRGIGKSLLLKKLAAMTGHYGILSAYVSLHEGDDEKSTVRKILELLRSAFLQKGIALPGRIFSLSSLLTALGGGMQKHAEIRGIALLLDNVDALRDPSHFLKVLSDLLEKMPSARGRLVVVSGMHFGAHCHFDALLLEAPSSAEVEHLLVHTLESAKIKWGNECLHRVIDDSACNPFVFLTMARVLYDRLRPEEKQLTRAHYLQHFNLILQHLAPLFDELYYKTSGQERKLLRALSRGEAQSVSQMAKKVHLPLNSVTTLALRLVKKGSLVKIGRGIYQLFNPIYGRYVLSR